MRGSKCKKLRRMAEGFTVGKPKVRYKWVSRHTVVLGECTRRVYKGLKILSREEHLT